MASLTLKETTVARLWVEYSTTTDISNNKSTTTLTLKLTTLNNYNIGSWGDYNGSYFGSTSDTFDGSIPNFSGTRNLKTITKTVNHNNEGKGSLTVYWKWGVNSSWGGFVIPSGQFTITLPDIPRVTQPVLSDSDVQIGDTIKIGLNRAIESHTHSIALYFGNKSLMIAEDVTTSYNWTVPEVIAKWIPNVEYMDAKITAFTYESGKLNGSKSADIKIRIPSDGKPEITSLTISEGSSTLENIGLYVQGHSSLKVDTVTSGTYYATIADIKSVIENVTYKGESFTTGVLMNAGDLTVSVEVTDSRGRKTTKSKAVKVHQYEPPKIISFDAKRCDSAGNLKENGTHAKITYQYEITPLENKNSKNVIIKYKDTQVSQYTDLVTLNEYSANSFYLTGEVIALTNSYDVRIEVKDSFTESSASTKIQTERVYADFLHGVLGLAIGKIAELPETFDVDLKTLFRKEVTFEKSLHLNNGLTIKPMQVTAEDDLNNFTQVSGIYYAGAGANRPIEASGFFIVIVNGANSVYQKFIALNGKEYERLKTSDGWSPWCGWFSDNQWKWKTSLSGDFEAYCTANLSGVYNTGNGGGYETSFDAAYLLPEGLNIVGDPLVFGNVSHSDSSYGYFRYIEISTLGSGFKAIKFRVGRLASNSNRLTSKLRLSVYGKWK